MPRTADALTGYRAGRALWQLLSVILSLGGLFLVGAALPPFVFAQATLENPAPNSFQSGIGIISGWACAARSIEIVFNDGPPQQAAYGTSRGDTHTACGDTDNGFGLLFNWNLLGDGVHTVQALADGVEFAKVQVHVTTLGAEFLEGVEGTAPLTDFPTPGSTLTLRWQPAQQNFAITDGSAGRGGGTSGASPHVLDIPVPGSFQSGLGVISGWACNAERIEITFDDGPPQEAAYGTSRGDTQGACGDTDNGFGLLFNWNLLGDGPHTVAASADGVEFARVEVTVTTLGREIQRGLSHAVTVPDFPAVGTDTVLQWSEAQQNFVITATLPTTELVAVNPAVTLPAGIQIPNVTVRSFYTETAEVLGRPNPSLLLAEDGDGTVLLGVANRDGGLLGERDGRAAVSVDSTAVVLVALRAGFAVHEIDPEVVDAIQGHADYAELAVTLAALVEADKNFLDTLMYYPDVLETIETISEIFGANGPYSSRGLSLKESLEGVASASEVGLTPLAQGGTGETDADACAHRAALWSMAEGADIAAMFAPTESIAAALRRAATAEQSPPPTDQADSQDTEELSLREIMKFFTDLTAAQHTGSAPSPTPRTQPADGGPCSEPTDPPVPGDVSGDWWEIAMRGYMDHRMTGGAEQENPFLACLPPAPPTNLRITDFGEDFVELAWDAPPGGGARTYNIYYRASANGPEELLDNVNTDGRRITGSVVPGECYRVSAVSADGVESEKTAPVCVVDESPGTPRNLRVTEVGVDFIDLEWDPPPEGEVESYTIFYGSEYDDQSTRWSSSLGTVETTSVRVRGSNSQYGKVCFAVTRWRIEDFDVRIEAGGDVAYICMHDTFSGYGSAPEGIPGGGCWLLAIGTSSDGHLFREQHCRGQPWGEPCSAADYPYFILDEGTEVTRVIVAGGQTASDQCDKIPSDPDYTLEPVPQPDAPPGS